MRNFLFALVAGLVLVPGLAFAGVDAADIPSVNGKGIIAEPGVAIQSGEAFVGTVIFWEADDSTTYDGPTGAVLDTGTEACAVFAMSCADTYIVDPAGGSGDELTDSACATDQSDNTLSLSFCY